MLSPNRDSVVFQKDSRDLFLFFYSVNRTSQSEPRPLGRSPLQGRRLQISRTFQAEYPHSLYGKKQKARHTQWSFYHSFSSTATQSMFFERGWDKSTVSIYFAFDSPLIVICT